MLPAADIGNVFLFFASWTGDHNTGTDTIWNEGCVDRKGMAFFIMLLAEFLLCYFFFIA